MNKPDNDVTQILLELRDGESDAVDRLLPLVYEELRAVAGRLFRSRQALEITIQPTMLVHDVFLKLVQKQEIEWESRAHFYSIASKAIRDLLIDQVRSRMTAKRGGNWNRVELTGLGKDASQEDLINVVDLDDALTTLGQRYPRQEQIVEMRFYGGMTNEEVAHVLGVTTRMITYDWRMARAWLRRHFKIEA